LDNYKTIKELADELGVSKDKIKYQVRKLPRDLPVKIEGVTYLNKAAIKIILDSLPGELPREAGNNTRVLPIELPSSELVENIKREIESKDYQIKRLLDNQDKIQNLLDQQQKLTLQSNKQIEKLQQQLLIGRTEDKEVEESPKKSQEIIVDKKEESMLKEQNENVELEKKKWFQFWK